MPLNEDDDAEPQGGFRPIVKTPKPRWDDDEPDPEATTYTDATHGPEPVPDWVITEDAARQFERGILKTGKEADVHLVERVLGADRNVLAAKRYRDVQERNFRNDAKYRRRTGDRRTDLAMAQGTRLGMGFRAQLWIQTEFDTLSRLWSAGAPVPNPVQMRDNELMLEYLGDEEEAAPRLVHATSGRDREQVADLFRQTADALRIISSCRIVHGDLSVYNLLVWDDRVFVIDFPQAVDPLLNTDGLRLLERDVRNLCKWFDGRGVETDADALVAECLSLVR